MRILVVNAGSSSLKLRVLDPHDRLVAAADLPPPRDPSTLDALRGAVAGFGAVDAVGHRVVHGGTRFAGPVRVDAAVERELRALGDLAPLHQAPSLHALDATRAVLPDVPAVACFDTAFHATIPPPAATYALPAQWRQRWPLRRFGFHGLSHAAAARRVAALLHRPLETLRIVTCHLGAGASLCAVHGGRSVDTTMGFTPLDGLVMATRSGSVDPGLLLWLEEHAGMAPADLADALEHRSGLSGLAGEADMAVLLRRYGQGDPEAALAVDVYVHRLRGAVAAMAAAMGGLDALAFTGGVGEHAPTIRALTADGLGFLGVELDERRNAEAIPAAPGTSDVDGTAPDAWAIGAEGAPVATAVVTAREDLEIAAQVRRLLG